MTFDVDAFLTGIKNDKTKSQNKADRLNKVLMNIKDNQGLLTYLPVYSSSINNFYIKIPKVYEYYGDTSLLDSGESWYKIMPLEFYGDLSTEDMNLIQEVKGYLDFLQDNESGFVENYSQFRIRNYSLFTGILKALKSTDDKLNEDLIDCPCLFTYPSNSPIDALGIAINNKIDAMKGKKDWIPYILNPNKTGYQGVVQISFIKKPNNPGYESTVAFELNSPINTLIDPNYVISDEIFDKFNDILPTFLGWMYDHTNKSIFNKLAFTELRNQLKDRVDFISKNPDIDSKQTTDANVSYENKNDLTKNTSEIPVEPTKKTPF